MIPTPEQETALIEAVRGAAKVEILPRFRNLAADDIAAKANADDLVTEADRRAERAISAAAARILPGAEIVGEEAVAADPNLLGRIGAAETCVIIDPVDGTWNFAKGLAVFGVLLAVTHGGETVFGLLYEPLTDDWILARRGGGTWYCTADGGRLRLDFAAPQAATELAGYSSPWLLPPQMRERYQIDLLRLGRVLDLRCACQTYRMMCWGNGQFSIDLKLMPWDHAAGVLAIREAGGAVGLLDGRDYAPTIHEGYLISARDAATLAGLRERFAWMLEAG